MSFRVEVVGQEVMAAASMAETEGRAALLRRRCVDSVPADVMDAQGGCYGLCSSHSALSSVLHAVAQGIGSREGLLA